MSRLLLTPEDRALAVLSSDRDTLDPEDVSVCGQCGVVVALPAGTPFDCAADPAECALRKDPRRANVGAFVEAASRALDRLPPMNAAASMTFEDPRTGKVERSCRP